MRFFFVVAVVVAGALASVIPKPNINEATHLLEVDADATDTIAFAGVQYSSVVFWEKANFKGRSLQWWWESERGAGNDPDTAICWAFQGGLDWASSIEYKQDGKRISCSFYNNGLCQKNSIWIGHSEPDLSSRAWDKQINGAKCWFFENDAHKKREQTAVANGRQSETPNTELATRDDIKEFISIPPGPIVNDYWVMTVHEHPNYGGNAYGYPDKWLPSKWCAQVPGDAKISSIRFNVDRNRIMCTGYKNGQCQDSDHTNGELGIVANFPDLRKYGFDDVLRSFKCWNHLPGDPTPVNGTVPAE